jgi:eukaryotic-like serine/threonine-protein kinase
MLESPDELLSELESSGLLSAAIARHRDALLKAPSAERAVQELVRLKLLTEFQAEVTLKQEAIPLIIGDYVVEKMLGRGGMGYVLKARHQRMKRPVAIKLLLNSLTDSEDFQKRFEREVEAAAQLDHQNIVTAYDAGIHDGNHYLVMQYVDGSDLAKIVKTQGPLGIAAAVDVIRQAAEGLECAHELGIVHRDIKPSNLLIDHKGVVRVLDMGLARIQRSPGDAMDGTGHADLTGTGSVLGTIDYMAPEQALDAKKADHRADIYSLGCTLYFLLTGNPPFGNETVMRRLLAHRQSKIPRLREVRPEAPDELEQIFSTMTAVDETSDRGFAEP